MATGELEVSARRLDEARPERQRRSGRWSTGIRRALIVICGHFSFQQITGINVPLYYGPHLLGHLLQSGHSKVALTTAGVEVTAVMTAVNVASTYLGFRYIDRIGRRRLALGGYVGMALGGYVGMALVAAGASPFCPAPGGPSS